MNLEIVSISSLAEVNLSNGPFLYLQHHRDMQKSFASNVSSLKPRTDAAKTQKS